MTHVKYNSLEDEFPDPQTLPKAYGQVVWTNDLFRINKRALRAIQPLFLVYTCPYCHESHVHGLEREQCKKVQQAPVMLAPCGIGKYAFYESGRWAA